MGAGGKEEENNQETGISAQGMKGRHWENQSAVFGKEAVCRTSSRDFRS